LATIGIELTPHLGGLDLWWNTTGQYGHKSTPESR
jgi:hypothetical protein